MAWFAHSSPGSTRLSSRRPSPLSPSPGCEQWSTNRGGRFDTGDISNAVIGGRADSNFKEIEGQAVVAEDTLFDLFDMASWTLPLPHQSSSLEGFKRFYDNWEEGSGWLVDGGDCFASVYALPDAQEAAENVHDGAVGWMSHIAATTTAAPLRGPTLSPSHSLDSLLPPPVGYPASLKILRFRYKTWTIRSESQLNQLRAAMRFTPQSISKLRDASASYELTKLRAQTLEILSIFLDLDAVCRGLVSTRTETIQQAYLACHRRCRRNKSP